MVWQRAFGFTALGLGVLSLWAGVFPQRYASAAVTPLSHLPAARIMAIKLPYAGPPKPGRFLDHVDEASFQRGNIHTHSSFSDGDSPPEVLYQWYRTHGYQWLAITDHNTLTDPHRYRLLEKKGKFVIVPGEEVTMMGGGKQVHVNALCTKTAIAGYHAATQGEALTWAIDQVHGQGGVALVNHPNWDWAFGFEALPSAKGAELLEIYSGHPYVHQEGDTAHASHEALWDRALTSGLDFTGAAVDDAHTFGARGPLRAARPGRGWVEVFAAEPTKDAICDALKRGRLYSSSGPKLKRIAVEGPSFTIWPAVSAAVVEFIGAGGKVLQKSQAEGADGARYELEGGETYVRARVTDPNHKQAWTAAYRVGPG